MWNGNSDITWQLILDSFTARYLRLMKNMPTNKYPPYGIDRFMKQIWDIILDRPWHQPFAFPTCQENKCIKLTEKNVPNLMWYNITESCCIGKGSNLWWIHHHKRIKRNLNLIAVRRISFIPAKYYQNGWIEIGRNSYNKNNSNDNNDNNNNNDNNELKFENINDAISSRTDKQPDLWF